jgi:hypothetical protein
MRDVAAELKSLRLYGMVGAWEEVRRPGGLGRLSDPPAG